MIEIQYSRTSMRDLEQLLGHNRGDILRIASRSGRYYAPFDIRRCGSSKWRHIDNPEGELRYLQNRIQRRLLRNLELNARVLGGVRDRSVVDNARYHLRKSSLVVFDIHACFPSISHRRIYNVFSETLGYSARIAGILTQLTTFQHRLPQGAPTSTMLANLALFPMQSDLRTLAATRGLEVSFWVDDIAMSGPEAERAIADVVDIIHRHGFEVSWSKLAIACAWAPQRVTGVGCNVFPSAGRNPKSGRRRIVEIRDEIYRLATVAVVMDYELQSIRGRIEWVRSVNPIQGAALERYASTRLPRYATPGASPETDEWRACRRAYHHER